MQLKNKLPLLMIVLGVSIALLSSIADFIGLGSRGGVPAMQIIGAEIGAVLALIGVWLLIRSQNEEVTPPDLWRKLTERIFAQPVFTWVLVGF